MQLCSAGELTEGGCSVAVWCRRVTEGGCT